MATNYFFSQQKKSERRLYKPLQTLGSTQVTAVHQMLHQCNIFKENSHKI